jgi:putative aldouronate transport system substrate-binding protein
MKRLALILAFALLLALFASCAKGSGDGETPTPTAAPTEDTSAETATPTQPPETEDPGPYNFAAGNYEVGGDGIPLGPYTYELPLTTTDEIFTLWTTLPILQDAMHEGGMRDMPYQEETRNRTGVNIEFVTAPFGAPGPGPRQDNFAVLLAADDLPDIVTNVDWYYPGALQQAFDDGYFENLYGYREYFPNYWYTVNSHPEDLNLMAKVVPIEETIYAFWCLEYEPVALHNSAIRADWLAQLGMINDDVVTLDDLYNVLKSFQTELGIEHPFLLYNTIDPHALFNCFDTTPAIDLINLGPPLLDDGKVAFANTRQQDKEFMTMINQWYNEGLCQPDWQSVLANGTDWVREKIIQGEIGLIGLVPAESTDYESLATDPNAEWAPIHKPVKEPGQVFLLGDQRSWLSYGSWFINTKCANIPLVCTWCDYFYSEEGIFFANYGVEGVSWEYNEEGVPQLTSLIVDNPGGLSWAVLTYAMNELLDGGVSDRFRSYAYPGGERIANYHRYWVDPEYYKFDASMQWPSAVTFTAEESTQIAQWGTDLTTYVGENYLLFVDGSKPLSEWDSYIEGVNQLHYADILAIYQAAYDRFIEKFGR